jgi:oxygen-independent coproporphyrinogen-3 oxidase
MNESLNNLNGVKNTNISTIYIHIPFCKQACHYCDFHFSTNIAQQDLMLSCINKEITLRKAYLPENTTIQSIYLGGGTPSLIKIEYIALLINNVFKNYKITEQPEITIEVNPDDIDEYKLKRFKQIGINRLSIGVQSFNNNNLKYLNRAHDKQKAIKSVDLARQVGLDNVSIDLIYCIPGSSKNILLSDLDTATSLSPTHISAYSLTIENRTFLGKLKSIGKLQEVDEEESAQQFEVLMQTLEAKKYEHYEISNFCLDKQYSKHNTNYWFNRPYLGLGPGAHSYNLTSRQYNIANNKKYIESLNKGIVPFYKEELTNTQMINEYIMTSIRTKWGTDTKKLLLNHGYNLLDKKKAIVASMISTDLIKLEDGIIFLKSKGKLLADKITQELFID